MLALSGPKPIVSVDFGSAVTKLGLFLQVETRFRLVCDHCVRPVKDETDAASVLLEGLQGLERLTGWELTQEEKWPGRELMIIATGSCAGPLPTLFLGPEADVVAKLAAVLLPLAPLKVAGSRAQGNEPSKPESASIGEVLARINESEIGLIVAAASSRQEASTIGAVLRAAQPVWKADKIPLLYSGPDEVADALSGELPPSIEFRRLGTDGWLHPRFISGQAQEILLETYDARLARQLNGLAKFESEGKSQAVCCSSSSIRRAGKELSQDLGCVVAVLDAGANTTTLSYSSPETQESNRDSSTGPGESFTAVGCRSGPRVVPDADILTGLRMWLPFEIDDDVLINYLANRQLRPQAVATTRRELLIEMAVARQSVAAIRRSFSQQPEALVGSGSLAAYPRLGQCALTMIDAIQPQAPCRLLLDRASILPRLGAISRVDSKVTPGLLNEALIDLGPCLSVLGHVTRDDVVAVIEVTYLDDEVAKEQQAHTFEIRYGTISLIPLAAGVRSRVKMTSGRKISFGHEKWGFWASGQRDEGTGPRDEVMGGTLGLIVDARGRPLQFSSSSAVRQARIMDWLQAVGGIDANELHELD